MVKVRAPDRLSLHRPIGGTLHQTGSINRNNNIGSSAKSTGAHLSMDFEVMFLEVKNITIHVLQFSFLST